MTPKEKGRFCSSCAKTVVDFTKKSTNEITDYLVKNKKKRVCGHFYKKQLDSIIIEIPEVSFNYKLSFQKLFILALFFVMGTTLFSCQYSDGKKQKIQDVIIIDTINKVEKEIESLKRTIKEDTIIISNNNPTTPFITGVYDKNIKNDEFIELVTTGDIVEELEIDGDISIIEIEEEEIIMGFTVEEPPKFKENKQEYFEKNIKNFLIENFNKKLMKKLDLKEGKYKIYTQFIIDKKGNMTNIKVRTPYPIIKTEVFKVFKKLPQFIPGKQAGKVVKTKYNLPITFVIK